MTVTEIMNEYNLSGTEVELIRGNKSFGLGAISEFEKYFGEGDMRIFPDYKTFFFWLFEDSDVNTLIEKMYDNEGLNDVQFTDKNQYMTLPDGRIVFQYQ